MPFALCYLKAVPVTFDDATAMVIPPFLPVCVVTPLTSVRYFFALFPWVPEKTRMDAERPGIAVTAFPGCDAS